MKIKNFKGVFMRDEIKDSAVISNSHAHENADVNANKRECMIINIDSSLNDGTHWTCLFIENDNSFYFDAFELAPSVKVVNYCIDRTASNSNSDNKTRFFNTFPIQRPMKLFADIILYLFCLD